MTRGRHGGLGEPREDFWGVLGAVWLSPRRFFEGLPDGNPVRPAIFATLVLYLNLVLEAALQAVWIQDFNVGLVYALFLGFVVSLVLGPLLTSALTLLVQVIHDGAPSRHTFRPIFRHLGYASGIGIVLWIPFGPFVAIPYGAYVATIAVKTALNTDWRRAAAAALIPFGTAVFIMFLLTGPTEAYDLLRNPPGS